MLHVAKRPFFLLVGASVSASAGFMTYHEATFDKKDSTRTLKATSRQELGLQQSLIRDVACWISSASVASTRQAFTTPSVPYPTMEEGKEVLEVAMKNSLVYQNLVSWLQQISPEKNGWDPDQILGSSSFSMLVNLLSDTENNLSLHEDLEEELESDTIREASSTEPGRGTRRRPESGGRTASIGSSRQQNCHFGPANLASLLSLAVADVPDQYLEFALWGLTKAATPEAVSRGYKLRKMILGDDSTTTHDGNSSTVTNCGMNWLELDKNTQNYAGHSRARILEDSDQGVAFVLDQDALSFVSDSGDGEPLYDDDIENINIVLRHGYVDGWIELFTAFLKSGDEKIREEAALCLEQIATYGSHKDEVVRSGSLLSWILCWIKSLLKSPKELAACKRRDHVLDPFRAKLVTLRRTRHPTQKLRALAFVMERTECQEELVRRGGIPILKILLRSENGLVQREAARVLANLFACDDMADELRDFAMNDCQLEAALEKWTQSEDIRLESMAHRARSNRRYQISRLRGVDMDNEVKYLDGIHPLHLSGSTRDQQSDYDVDIVFVHGLLGCPFSTWTCGEEEDTVWAQQWLLDDMKQEGLNPRVLSVGYDSQLLASGSIWKPLCFEETGSEILSQLNAARVGCGDRPVVFVTHSLGGVLLKQVLMASATPEAGEEESSLIDNVNGVVFFGVPHHGSPVAQRIQTFKPRQITQHPVTEHLHGTPHLEMLNDWCSEVFEEKDIPCLSVGESLPCRLPVISVEALVVPPTSANPGFGEFVPISDATHVDVCKPATTYDLRYKLVRKFISKNATTSATTQSKQRRL
ncbi:Alpha/Beta hydrolase fold [Phytophthora cactorum]|nr:Alpha/Beta hydrolase fold [Phytophthora cactorum]